MSRIPNDIMIAADAVFSGLPEGVYCDPEVVIHIAAAILAERKACEKVARDRASSWFEEPHARSTARADEAEKIADIIASGVRK